MAASQILAIITQEKDKRFWRRMANTLGKPRSGACFWVQVEEEDGTTREHTGQDDLHEAIWDNIHRRLFHLAESVLLCQFPLRGIFGYNAICQTSQKILDGTYEYPEDFDLGTREILEECARIRLKIPSNLVSTWITRDDWENHWGKANELTSLLVSG